MAKSFVKVTWAWMTVVEVTVIETAFYVVPVATYITMTNSLCSGCACATH